MLPIWRVDARACTAHTAPQLNQLEELAIAESIFAAAKSGGAMSEFCALMPPEQTAATLIRQKRGMF